MDHGDTKHDSFFELGKISASPPQTQKRVGSLECSLYEPVILYEAQKLTGYFPSTFFQQSKCLFLPWEARLPPNSGKKKRFPKNVFLEYELFPMKHFKTNGSCYVFQYMSKFYQYQMKNIIIPISNDFFWMNFYFVCWVDT